MIEKVRYIVYYGAIKRTEAIDSFFSRLSEKENRINALKSVRFESREDMIRTVTESVKGMKGYISLKFSASSFTYSLKHRGIESRTSRMGFFVIFTSTKIGADKILGTYRGKRCG